MFQIKKSGKVFEMPLSDQQMFLIEQEMGIDLFVPIENTVLVKAEFLGVDLKEKLPDRVWAQEINMLAYALDQLNQVQGKKFLEEIAESTQMYPGEMLNHVLRICPMAAGITVESGVAPYYTGENLFDIMEYKRFADRKREYPQFQIAKLYFPIDVSVKEKDDEDFQELDGAEAAVYSREVSDMIARKIRRIDSWSDWELYAHIHQDTPYTDTGFLFSRPDAEVRDGVLQGAFIVEAKHILTESEISIIKEYLDGGITDGWGESMEPAGVSHGKTLAIKLGECSDVRQQIDCELNEIEMFFEQSPLQTKYTARADGFTADFRKSREYGRDYPVWIELNYDRKTIRVPLPATEKDIQDARTILGITDAADVRTLFRSSKLKMVDKLLFANVDLEAFNRLAQGIHATDPETMYRVLENLSVDPLTPEQRIKCITMTLKSARRENSSNPAVKKV